MLHELTAGPSAARPTPKCSFLPEFADARNRELDTDIQASGHGRRSGFRGNLSPAAAAATAAAAAAATSAACPHPSSSPRPPQALEAELELTQISLDENEEHTRVLAEHLDSVRLEIKHTQVRQRRHQRRHPGRDQARLTCPWSSCAPAAAS